MASEPNMWSAGRVRCLTVHADYLCRRSGACCTSGWRIPVEARVHTRLVEALATGTLRAAETADAAALGPLPEAAAAPSDRLFDVDDPPEGCASWLGSDRHGRCLFYEVRRGTCAIHRQMGEHALPVSCRQFPRVSLTDARGTGVTLSHYCPTAAHLLVNAHTPLAIVVAPPILANGRDVDGLDARGALPPLVHPQLLHSLDSYDLWERGVVSILDREDLTIAQAVACLVASAERIRAWTPSMGPLDAYVDRSLAGGLEDASDTDPRLELPATALRLWDIARASVPEGVEAPARPDAAIEAWEKHAAAGWSASGPAIRRYLAARAFASWLAYQGRGARTTVLGIVVALGVVLAEAARACAGGRRDLDDRLLIDAIRASDLLLVHLVDPVRFADRLGLAERAVGRTRSPLEWLA